MSTDTAKGLITFARLLEQTLEREGWSERELARRAGIGSSTTISHWLGNRHRTSKFHEPSFYSIVKVAPHLLDPRTSKPFEPMELFAVIQGESLIPPELLGD